MKEADNKIIRFVYKQVDGGEGEMQRRLDDAFNLLFDETSKQLEIDNSQVLQI